MSKYPYVILFRHSNYSEIDSFIESNRDAFMCTIHITSYNVNDLKMKKLSAHEDEHYINNL